MIAPQQRQPGRSPLTVYYVVIFLQTSIAVQMNIIHILEGRSCLRIILIPLIPEPPSTIVSRSREECNYPFITYWAKKSPGWLTASNKQGTIKLHGTRQIFPQESTFTGSNQAISSGRGRWFCSNRNNSDNILYKKSRSPIESGRCSQYEIYITHSRP